MSVPPARAATPTPTAIQGHGPGPRSIVSTSTGASTAGAAGACTTGSAPSWRTLWMTAVSSAGCVAK
jgi:hypothetical protein